MSRSLSCRLKELFAHLMSLFLLNFIVPFTGKYMSAKAFQSKAISYIYFFSKLIDNLHIPEAGNVVFCIISIELFVNGTC